MSYRNKTKKFSNPIIPGSYADPSICRVGEDYYLVNSSFEYFPAIPVWHSKDLVNWQQIGNAIDREEQMLGLEKVKVDGGVQACTIRYNNGIFYIISTSVGKEWPRLDYNFIITAKDPKGPWSKVNFIQDAPGIDSSLFFDDDGKVYFHANRQKEKQEKLADAEIWMQEIDLDTFELKGEKHVLWDGCGGIFPEGPHIYKRNGYYYLLVAEGGTGHWHTVTMARSKNIFGTYESNPRNPILTHKHLGLDYPIQNVGHADMVETQNGEWYMVCLGSRPRGERVPLAEAEWSTGGHYANMGRETFLVPMVWEDDFGPIVSPETGRVEEEFDFPNLKEHRVLSQEGCVHFNKKTLDFGFNTIKNEKNDFYSLEKRPGFLRLYMLEGNINEETKISFIGRRQTSWNFSASTKLEVKLNVDGEEAGITSYYKYRSHFRLGLLKEDGKVFLKLVKKYKEEEAVLESVQLDTEEIYLMVNGNDQDYDFYYAIEEGNWIKIGETQDGRMLSPYGAGGYCGNYLAMYASSNGTISNNYADFDYFEYINIR